MEQGTVIKHKRRRENKIMMNEKIFKAEDLRSKEIGTLQRIFQVGEKRGNLLVVAASVISYAAGRASLNSTKKAMIREINFHIDTLSSRSMTDHNCDGLEAINIRDLHRITQEIEHCNSQTKLERLAIKADAIIKEIQK